MKFQARSVGWIARVGSREELRDIGLTVLIGIGFGLEHRIRSAAGPLRLNPLLPERWGWREGGQGFHGEEHRYGFPIKTVSDPNGRALGWNTNS